MSVDLAICKTHLRVSGTSEDALITAYLNAATAWIERYTGAKLTSGGVTETFTDFGDYLELGLAPANSVTSITYLDADGESATVADSRLRDGRIYPPVAGWPSYQTYSTITVAYNAGFATTPTELEQAQLLLVGHFYQYRDENAPIPQAVEALCGPFRTPTVR